MIPKTNQIYIVYEKGGKDVQEFNSRKEAKNFIWIKKLSIRIKYETSPIMVGGKIFAIM